MPARPAVGPAPLTPLKAPVPGFATKAPGTSVPPAPVAASTNHAAPGAANPAFIGPPVPPGLLAKGMSPAVPGVTSRPAGPGAAVAASAQGMSVSMKPVAGPSVSHLDEHMTYQYNALGRRDPFHPLIGGAYVGGDEGGEALPDLGGLRIVGIVWGTDDQFAMAEDGRGQSMVLRRGDKVLNGVVEALKRDGVVVNLTVDGQSQSVVVPLTKKGDR